MGMRFPFLVCTFLLGMLTVCGDSVSQERVPPTSAADDVPKPVNKDGRWGYVNATGQFVIQPKYFAAEPFSEGLALVVTRKPSQPFGNEYGEFRLAQITYIDRSGHEILAPLSVRRARSFADGRALVVPDSILRIKGGMCKRRISEYERRLGHQTTIRWPDRFRRRISCRQPRWQVRHGREGGIYLQGWPNYHAVPLLLGRDVS